MNIELTRPKNIIYIHIVLVTFLLLMLYIGEWMITNNYDHSPRYSLKGLSIITLVALPFCFAKILLDIYLVYYKKPLLLLKDNHVEINNIFIKNTTIPLASIDNVKIKKGSNASNIKIYIKKTLFKNFSKTIYEVTFTKDAEMYLENKGVKYQINDLR